MPGAQPRRLAYRGAEPEALRDWIRDVYLVAREPGAMHFPTLLGSAGGVAAYHEDADRWLRAPPPPVPPRELREAWRQWESPAGGVIRYGLAHRRRWIAALQLSRLEPGAGFRPAELELLERVAPTLARALAERLRGGSARPAEAGGYSVLVRRASGAESSLTGAQWAVAQAIARGLSDREIADSLQISTSTVHEHVAALHAQLGTTTRPRLVAELAGALPRR